MYKWTPFQLYKCITNNGYAIRAIVTYWKMKCLQMLKPPIPEELQTMNKLERQYLTAVTFHEASAATKRRTERNSGAMCFCSNGYWKDNIVLPRGNADNQLVRCKLKRKIQYKGHSQYEFVSINKIRKGLEYWQENNSYHSDVSLHTSWRESVPPDVTDVAFEDEANITVSSQEEGNGTDTNKETGWWGGRGSNS